MSRIRTAWLLLLLLSLPCAVPAAAIAPGQLAVVADDGNNLRAFGGPNYRQAQVLDTLGRGMAVRVLRQDGTWSEVETRANTRGWVHSACLVPIARYLADPKNHDDVLCPGDYPRAFTATLGPGQAGAKLRLDDVATLDGGGGRLTVSDASGKVLWRGPGVDLFADAGTWSPLFYFCSQAGAYWPSVIGDIDGDGWAEIVAFGPQSDISVSSFSVARWNGQAFTVVRRHQSLLEEPPGSGRFNWKPAPEGFTDAHWIMDIKALDADGTARATVYEYGPNLPLRFGLARVRFDQTGAKLLSWIEPLRSSE